MYVDKYLLNEINFVRNNKEIFYIVINIML